MTPITTLGKLGDYWEVPFFGSFRGSGQPDLGPKGCQSFWRFQGLRGTGLHSEKAGTPKKGPAKFPVLLARVLQRLPPLLGKGSAKIFGA